MGSERGLARRSWSVRGQRTRACRAKRYNREFVQVLIDTLKIERPAYRELQRYLIDRH